MSPFDKEIIEFVRSMRDYGHLSNEQCNIADARPGGILWPAVTPCRESLGQLRASTLRFFGANALQKQLMTWGERECAWSRLLSAEGTFYSAPIPAARATFLTRQLFREPGRARWWFGTEPLGPSPPGSAQINSA
jgi:hypothetical protein